MTTPEQDASFHHGAPYFEIFAASLAGLLLEVAYTRVFSFKVFYYFTYLIIGVGLLGIGAGGVALSMSSRLRAIDPLKLMKTAFPAGGLSVILGYWVISPTQLNVERAATDPSEFVKLLMVCIVLMVPFFAIGLVVSTILSTRPESANRLYGADLLGAAVGATLCIPLLVWLTPPRVIALAGLALAVGGVRLARTTLRDGIVAGAAIVLLALPVLLPKLLPDPVVAKSKSFEDFRSHNIVRFSQWNPVFRIDVSDHPFHPGELYLVHHDGLPGSGLRRFDGDLHKFDSLRQDPRSLPFEILPPHPRVLIIGSAGGHEVLASLFFDASHVTGVELNKTTLSLLTDVFADITGRLNENPKVTLINGDGRWFLKQTDQKFDLIWFVAPDSYAAMNAATSGSFVLSESYLYTVEALEESFRHLTPVGIVCTQFGELDYAHKPNRTTRYLVTARTAMRETGIENFPNHVMVASAAGFPPFLESAVLLSPKGFTPEQADKFTQQAGRIQGGIVRHVPARPPDPTPVNRVITLDDAHIDTFLASYRYEVGAVRDDSPFFWHFSRFRDAIRAPLPGAVVDYEDTIAEQVTLVFLALASLLAAAVLLLPFSGMRSAWAEVPHKRGAAAYFAALGIGFMFLEVALIQKLTLFLGYPTYSLTITLFGILVFSGIGSILSARYHKDTRRAVLFLLAIIAVLVGSYQLILPIVIDHFVGHALAVRVLLTVVFIAPVALCLGAFMPIGLRTVAAASPHSRQYVAWAWAINGFFSVIASILSTIYAMAFGFRSLMLAAIAVYAIGVFALTLLPAPRRH